VVRSNPNPEKGRESMQVKALLAQGVEESDWSDMTPSQFWAEHEKCSHHAFDHDANLEKSGK
jgi:hypothetical protein